MNDDKVRTYIPDRHLKMGLGIWKEMFDELIRSRELIWRLFLRDFNARYKQTILGVLWVLILPLVAVAVFVCLNKGGILNIGMIDVPYPVFALFGITIWTIFASGLSATSNSLVQAGSMIVKINFPRVSLVIAATGQVIVEFLVRLGLLVVVFIIFKTVPHWQTIFLPLVILPLVLLTIGLGFVLSLASGVMRDIPNVVVLATSFLMFICPVFYPVPKGGIFADLSQWNPLAHLMNASRDIVFKGYLSNPEGFIWSTILAVLVFLVGWKVFYIA
ncbi:MAG: ABC transporter permease, partial [Planctomycetota bacterium]|nr:ABC transporter permease [Planctomycetota bacterium]